VLLAYAELGLIGHLLPALDGGKTPSNAPRTFTVVVRTCSADTERARGELQRGCCAMNA
jgi:hypothetical protein